MADGELRIPLLYSASYLRVYAVPGIDFRAVRTMVAMTEVLHLIGYPTPAVRVVAFRGPCPIHRSTSMNSRSFAVHVQRKMYRCFTCGSSGNHLDLYAAATRQGLYQAAVALCEQLRRPIPWLDSKRSR